jgi:hypothetical protein
MICRWALVAVLLVLAGCAGPAGKPVDGAAQAVVTGPSAPLEQGDPQVIPSGAFAAQPGAEVVSLPPSPSGKVAVLKPGVVLYASQSSVDYWQTQGVDHKLNIRVWEIFLRKYRIPFDTVKQVEKLESASASVLILPSSVALTEREMLAVRAFRLKGGSVLSTWVAGVRSDKGQWLGFGFMRDVLGVSVVGDSSVDEDVGYMMTFGEGLVTHQLPAGQRVWLERVKGLYPVKLVSQSTSAQLVDWSRKLVPQSGGVVVANEQVLAPPNWSRVVALGFGERVWMSADPKSVESIMYTSLAWLLRQPDAYLANWPLPHQSAMAVAIDAPEVLDDLDVLFSQRVERLGTRATFYVSASVSEKSRPALQKLITAGHFIGYYGDKFEGFRGQSPTKQAERLQTMVQTFKLAGVLPTLPGAFEAPMLTEDATTVKLISEMGFGSYVGFMDKTDDCLPKITSKVQSLALVMLPHTLDGPEDLIAEGDPVEGRDKFLQEYDLAIKMGGVALAKFPNQSLLSPEDADVLFERFARSDGVPWRASPHEVAAWWADRDHLMLQTQRTRTGFRWVVQVGGGFSGVKTPYVVVTLPYPDAAVSWVGSPVGGGGPSIARLDAWRVAVPLAGLKEGTNVYEINVASGAVQ